MRNLTVIGALVGVMFLCSLLAQSSPLTYRQALDIALSRNLELAAARRLRVVREAGILMAKQRPNPEFSMEVTRDTPHEAFTLGLPLELGGQRARRIELAREEVSLAELDEQQALTTMMKALRQSFYGLLAADQRILLASEALNTAERARDVASERFKQGDAPRLDVIEAELGVARAQAELDLAQSSRASALADLNTVLNAPPGQPVQISGSLLDTPVRLTVESAMEQASRDNVELRTAEREAAVEQRRLALLRAERVPTPTVSAGVVTDAPGEFAVGPTVGLTLALPLFNRNQGEIAQSLATIDQIQAHRDAVRRSVENRVFGAVSRVEAQRRQLETYQKKLIPAASELERLAQESYRLGRNSVLAVLDAQRSLRDVKREFLQAEFDYQMAIAELEEAVGGALE